MKGGIAIFEEFAKEVQATLKDLPKVTSDDYVIDFTDKAMDMLDAIFYNTTPDKIKLTNCIKVAANAYRLYEAFSFSREREYAENSANVKFA